VRSTKNNQVPEWTRSQGLEEAAGAARQSSESGENPALEAQLSHFEALLSGSSVDLSRISDEIRRRPELEALTMQLAVTPGPFAEEAAGNLEKAIVLLGASRLRVLVYAWFLIQQSSPILLHRAKNSDSGGHSGAGNARFVGESFSKGERHPAPELVALTAWLADEHLLLEIVALAQRCDANLLRLYLRAVFAIMNGARANWSVGNPPPNAAEATL